MHVLIEARSCLFSLPYSKSQPLLAGHAFCEREIFPLRKITIAQISGNLRFDLQKAAPQKVPTVRFAKLVT